MALLTSSGTVTNGLVFSYDVNNRKSYKGPPLRNHIQTIEPLAGSGDGFVLTGGSEVVDIPTLGQTNVRFSNYQNINSGGNYCCVSFMNYGNAGNIFTGSTLYTYLILYRTDSGYTHPNWMYRYEFNSSGTYQTEGGVHDTSRRTYLGNGWYYAWGTFTTQPATTNLQCYSFTYNYSSFNDKISVAKVCILPGNYSGLHPSLWPDVNTTRTNTQTLLDLTNNNTITAQSLTYASDNTFSFDGSSNYITSSGVSDTLLNSGSWTMSAWVKFAQVSKGSDNGLFGHGSASTNSGLHLAERSSKVYFGFYANDMSSNITLSSNVWYNITFVFDFTSKLKTICVNGVIDVSGGTVGYSGTGSNFTIGDYPWAMGNKMYGSLTNVQIYNRALTASEVLQNFNAQRGRYGI